MIAAPDVRTTLDQLERERQDVEVALCVARNHAPLLERLAELDRAITRCRHMTDADAAHP